LCDATTTCVIFVASLSLVSYGPRLCEKFHIGRVAGCRTSTGLTE
jgi:hypothetical protein